MTNMKTGSFGTTAALLCAAILFLSSCAGPFAAQQEVSPAASPETTASMPPGDQLKVRGNVINLRSTPDISSDTNIIGQLVYEQPVIGLGAEGDFTRVFVPQTQSYGYIHSELLVDENEILYAQIPKKHLQKVGFDGRKVFEADGVTPVMVTNNLVDIRRYISNIHIDLVFATEDNYMGAKLYARSIPLLQLGTVKKLKKAADAFAKDGYTIVLCDAYRPLSVQKLLYNKIKDSRYVANPYTTGSDHNRGSAVDMMLMDSNSVLLEMPTPMMTLNETANRGNKSWSQAAKDNVDYMTKVMKKAGFFSITTEWWHFADNDRELYMYTDYDFASIRMIPEDWF